MRRTLLLLSLLASAAALAAPAAAGTLQGERPPLAATLAACAAGATPDERFAVFTGSMPAIRGTQRMAMRFTLLLRSSADAPWEVVRARGFGRWERSDPGRAGFVYTKRVERLLQGRSYRVIVRYRWYGARGALQRTRVRRSPVCRQPDQRPDLEVDSVAVADGPEPGTYRYAVGIFNAGRSAAGPFDVGAAGLERDVVRPVAGVPAGERATVELVGPRCEEGETVTFRLDARGTVDEADERDNGFRWRCVPPIPSSG
jgi:hypothetical protein